MSSQCFRLTIFADEIAFAAEVETGFDAAEPRPDRVMLRRHTRLP